MNFSQFMSLHKLCVFKDNVHRPHNLPNVGFIFRSNSRIFVWRKSFQPAISPDDTIQGAYALHSNGLARVLRCLTG